MKLLLAPIGAALAVSVASTGVAATAPPDSAAAAPDFAEADLHGDGEKIVLFTYAPANEYLSVYTETLTATLEEYGYDVEIFTNQFSQSQQDQQVQQYLATGETPAVFLWVPFDAEGAVNSNRLLAAAAPVIQLNVPVIDAAADYVTAFSGNNSYEQGRLTGEIMMQARDEATAGGRELHSEGGNVLVFHGSSANFSSRERFRGFTAATADAPFAVLEESFNLTPDDAFENALTLIPKYSDEGIDFAWVYTDTTAASVIRAFDQNGLSPGDDVTIVGANCGDPGQILDGSEYGTTLQVAYVESTAAAFTTLQFLAADGTVSDGETTYPASAELPDVPLVAPSRYNYIPLLPIVGAEGMENTMLWGKPATELCVG